MTRRTKGEGSIIKLTNGHYKVRIELEPVDGKRKWLSSTVPTKTEAVAKLKEMQRQKEDTKQLKKLVEDNTIKGYIDKYLSYKTDQGTKVQTLYNMKVFLTNVSVYFNGVPVTSITTDKVQELVSIWRKDKQLATVKDYVSILKNFFNWLLIKKVVSENVILGIVLPKVKKSHSKRKLEVLSLEEHHKLKEILTPLFDVFRKTHKNPIKYRFLVVYMLTYETGLREGEVSGLQWQHISFEDNTITVDNTTIYNYLEGHNTSGDPKSDAGFRDIVISQDTMNILKELKELYKSYGYTSEYVFPAMPDSKTPFSPQEFNKILKKFLRQVGITRKFTFHDIRHTNASIMIDSGVSDPVITERLGHSDISVTHRTYAHVIKECQDRGRAVVVA